MTVRKNVTMSEETAQWYEARAKEIGTTQSALMAIALTDYIKQENVIKTMTNLMSEMKKLEELKQKIELPRG